MSCLTHLYTLNSNHMYSILNTNYTFQVTLPCSASGVPTPSIEWRRKDGHQLPKVTYCPTTFHSMEEERWPPTAKGIVSDPDLDSDPLQESWIRIRVAKKT